MSTPFDPDALPAPPRRGGRGRARPEPTRVPLSRERIVDAAMAVIDAEGLDALSMRRVATELGTGPASLYQHVASKEELLELCVNRVASAIPVPEPDPDRWEEQLKECMRALFHGLLAHRDLARASMGQIPTAPEGLAVMDGFLGVVRASGLSDQVVAWSGDLLSQYVVAAAYEHSLFARMSPDEVERYVTEIRDYFERLPADRFPNLSSLAGPLMHNPDPFARFEFGLDIIVRGLASTRKH